MADYVDGIKESTKELEKQLAVEKQVTAELQKHVALEEKKAKASRSGATTQIANYSSTTSPTSNNGTRGYSGDNPYTADQTGPYSAGQASKPPRFSGLGTTIAAVAKGAVGAAMGVANMLPTLEEATSTQLIKSRMQFYNAENAFPSTRRVKNPLYGVDGVKTAGKYMNIPTGYKNPEYRMMRDLNNLGTSVTPSDAQAAINNGIQMGFLPSLSNYSMGEDTDKTRFSGILGGAALASNLAPGIGIQGGMQVMGSINQAQNVNMLRMLGVQVRNSKGTGMNDLPAIIEQIYKLLARGGNITVKDIAESLLPGNALDSLLNQYLGGDVNSKNVVIAGLIQRVKKGDLRISGKKDTLIESGGSTEALKSISSRNASELGMIQKYSGDTANAMVAANNTLTEAYAGITKGSAGGFNLENVIKKVINVSTKLDVYSGARGGAGQQVMQAILDAGGDAYAGAGGVGKLLIGGAGLAGLWKMASADPNTKALDPTGNAFGNNGFFGAAATANPSNPGQIYTGAITVNVAVPPGQDPYSYGLAIGQAMTARS
jgi:hypothetical protein